MSKVDQLLAKALSTTSEDEAIACLRMARRQPGVEKTDAKRIDNNVDWHSKAEQYYNLSKDLQHRLNMMKASHEFAYKQMNDYFSMYSRKNDDNSKLRREIRELKSWYRTRDAVVGSLLAGAVMVALIVIL